MADFKIVDPPRTIRYNKFTQVGTYVPRTSEQLTFSLTTTAIQQLKPFLFTPQDYEEFISEKRRTSELMGVPVFDWLRFPAFEYTDIEGYNVKVPEIIFDAVLLNVNMTRNIIKTAIQGRNGTVKEFVSDGDYQINADIVIYSNNFEQGKRPVEEIEDFIKLARCPNAIQNVDSPFLNLLDIDSVVIESYSLAQEEGRRDNQRLQITMTSDRPVELEILEEDA